ncbi:hypothetical protein AcV5_001689 [Taiwanofungus camphoratus]|nr:hypothetical protein AcV5_001689 [Antrodia cinnamomea]
MRNLKDRKITGRDTVERMTHPPKPKSSVDGSGEERTQVMSSSRSKASRKLPADNSASVATIYSSPSSARISASTPNPHPNSSASFLPMHQSSTPRLMPTPIVSSTPRVSSSPYYSPRSTPKASSTPKTPLKSALRVNPSSTPAIPEDSSFRATPAKSLRTVKSMVAKTANVPLGAHQEVLSSFSAASAVNVTSYGTRSRAEDTMLLHNRPRSFLPQPRSKSKSKSNPSTPQSPAKFPTFATPQPAQSVAFTSVPRLHLHRPSGSSTSSSDSSSDLERILPRSLIPGRLVVTNATVDPSSSDSEEIEKEVVDSHGPWISKQRQRTLQNTGIPIRSKWQELAYIQPSERWQRPINALPGRPVGLGLQMGPQSNDLKTQRLVGTGGGEEDIYDEEPSNHLLREVSEDFDQYGSKEKTSYDDEVVVDPNVGIGAVRQRRFHEYTESNTGDEGYRRRHEAILGIVDGLQLDIGKRSAIMRQSVLSQSESDGQYAQGLAITVSGEVGDANVAGSPRLPTVEEQRTQEDNASLDDESIYSEDDAGEMYEGEGEWKMSRHTRPPKDEICRQSSANIYSSLRTSRRYGYESHGETSSWTTSGDNCPPKLSTSATSESSPDQQSCTPSIPAASDKILFRGSKVATLPTENFASSKEHEVQQKKYITSTTVTDPSSNRQSMCQAESLVARPDASKEQSPDQRYNSYKMNTNARGKDISDREREAFGIPHSLSYGASSSPIGSHSNVADGGCEQSIASNTDDESLLDAELPNINSNLSPVGDDRWQKRTGDEGLSKGAEALFENLTIGGSRRISRAPWQFDTKQSYNPSASPGFLDIEDSNGRKCRRTRLQDSTPSSVSISSSIYTDQSTRNRARSPTGSSFGASWRSTLQAPVYDTLLSHYGPLEIQRQELIYDLLRTEQAFARRLRSVIQSFILPLRYRDSTAWLPGTPLEISCLFDWLEDIVNLHFGIARSLKTVTHVWQAGALVERVAKALMPLMSRLEIYQPYLIRVDEVREMIAECASNAGDEFGEYVRMREQEEEWVGSTLETILQEPVNRLVAYPEIFERLLGLTPKHHADYLATVSLLYSTKTIIHVMDEVRIQEDEYEFVKDVVSRIAGLPTSAPIAKRERRLLHHGELHLIDGSKGAQLKANLAESTSESTMFLPDLTPPKARQTQETSQTSRLASAIHKWYIRRAKSGSVSSSESATTSVQSHDTVPPRALSSIVPTSELCTQSESHNRACETQCSIPVQIFVFTDIILLAAPVGAKGGGYSDIDDEDRWCLLSDVGLSRILGVTERHEDLESDHLVILDLLPLRIDQFQTEIVLETASIEVTLILPPESALETSALPWLTAFRRCQEHTIRSLSLTASSVDRRPHYSDTELDTRHTLTSILACGLPLPKSPSMQLQESPHCEPEDQTLQEREERGWWTLRFQQVLHEMQRQDTILSPRIELKTILATAVGHQSRHEI